MKIKRTSALQHKTSNRPVYYAVLVVKWAIGNGRDTLLTSAQGTEARCQSVKDLVCNEFAHELFGGLGRSVIKKLEDDTET